MKFLKRFFAGMGIGVGAAIPGVSGAAIALICNVFEDIINAISSFSKNIKKSIIVLLPILLGVVCAVIPCIYLFSLAFEHLMFILICIFAGFLIGSLPSVKKETRGVKPTKLHIVLLIIGIVFVVSLGVLSVIVAHHLDLNALFLEMPIWLYFVLIPVGIIASTALTVPGLSGSLILLVIGFYRPLVDSTVLWAGEIFKYGDWSNFGKLIGMLGCFAIGCLIGVVLTSKLLKKLTTKYHDATYFAILGFVIGSIFVLFFNNQIFDYYTFWAGGITLTKINPLMPMWLEILLGIILAALSCIGSYLIVRKSMKKEGENNKKPPLIKMEPRQDK